jgi:prepilin-type N-terminal cleavage/methylation domain-containing protein
MKHPAFSPNRTRRAGFTLVEVMMTVGITSGVLLCVAGGMLFNQRAQKMTREHTLAQRQAASLLEEARRTNFRDLVPYSNHAVLIDNNRTPDDPSDDLMGRADLRIYRQTTGEELASAEGESYVSVQTIVRWNSPKHVTRRLTMVTHFSPQ